VGRRDGDPDVVVTPGKGRTTTALVSETRQDATDAHRDLGILARRAEAERLLEDVRHRERLVVRVGGASEIAVSNGHGLAGERSLQWEWRRLSKDHARLGVVRGEHARPGWMLFERGDHAGERVAKGRVDGRILERDGTRGDERARVHFR
jgi:hypothetical protein